MSAIGLNKILNPKSIAVIGASDREGSVGYTLMRNLIELEYPGKVYPVNIRRSEILGLKAYQTVDQLPDTVDLAIIATPAKTVPHLVEQCGEAGITGIIIISAGFKEIGPEGKALEERIVEIRKKYNQRIIGPNCLGIIRPSLRLNATFITNLPKPGTIAFISQSGALGSAILDLAMKQNIGFSNFVSVGSMIDVDFGDLIEYFGTDSETRSILMYIEGITDARNFVSAARHFAKTKPIIVAKSGRFSESARAASSHTGALAGEDMIYDAAFKRAGLVRVDEIADLFHCAEVLGMQPLPKGPNLAIITNAGGPGVMATDALIARHGKLAELSQETMDKLNSFLPSYWSRGNPIDILGDSRADRYKPVIEACLDDANVNGLLVIYTGQAMGDPLEIAKSIVEICQTKGHNKTILTSFMGHKTEEANKVFTRNRIPTFSTPEQAVKTYMYMYQYKRNLEMLYETAEELPADITSPKIPLITIMKNAALEDREILTEEEAKAFLAHYNIPVVRTQVARTADEAAVLASQMGYPVVLKILSPQIIHKTDVGGVALDITSKTELEESFDLIMKRAKDYNANAKILGVTVQPMIKKQGYEVIIGAKNDPLFGPAILFGMGGIGVEVFKDVVAGLPPLNRALARRVIEETKVYQLLNGYRNIPPANIKLLEEILVRFSQMLVDFPQLKEVDINPLFINEKEALALDARIVIDKEGVFRRIEPHKHLLVRPYPTRYEDFCKLQDGRMVLLRPIKPEDEPLWLEMFQNFSEESVRQEFFQTIRDTPHEIRVRYCNIDYDKEIAIVAELAEEGRRRIIGVVRLITEMYGKSGEITVIVADPWQGLGLGSKLIDHITEICKDRQLETIHAKTHSDNHRAIKMLKKKEFTIEYLRDGTIKALRDLCARQ